MACARYPAIAETLERLRSYGDARMSGTGSSVFCPFATRSEAMQAQQHFGEVRGFVARGLNQSPLKAPYLR